MVLPRFLLLLMFTYSISDTHNILDILTHNMSLDGTHLMMAQLAELRINREGADVTLNCQGEVIMAHSLILRTRLYSFRRAN